MGNVDATGRLLGDGTLRFDLAVAALVAVALAGTGWLIREELNRSGGRDAGAVRVAVAEKIVGSAKRRPDASLVWSRVEVGESLMRGDGVFVAEDGALDVRFRDGSRLSVSESSLVVVDIPGSDEGAQPRVAVRRGSVAGHAGGRGLVLEVHGGSVALPGGGVASVSGGVGATTRISVEKGHATVQDESGTTARVSAQQTTTVSDGRVAEARDLTVQLRAPESGATIYTTREAAVVPFSWSGGSGVLEVADDASFQEVVRRRAAADGVTVRLAAGSYFWRVIDDDDGLPQSSQRSLSVVRDEPPAPLQPTPGGVVYLGAQQAATFAWSRVTGVTTYRVEIATSRAFREPVFSVDVDAPQLRFANRLPEGDYWWRVRSVAEQRGESPWSIPVPFKLAVEPLPRAPELYDSEVEVIDGSKHRDRPKRRKTKKKKGASLLYHLFLGGVAHAATPSAAIVLRWEAVPGVRGYILEIAEDKGFANVVVREELTESWYRWRKISKRQYWWRVKSVDAKGREGVFSQPRSVGAVLRAPRLLLPEPGRTVRIGARAPAIEFAWDEQRLAARYEWQIARDSGFDRDPLTVTRKTPKHRWTPTAAGTWFWRVRAADNAGSFTSYSKTHRLQLTLAAPEGKAVTDEITMSDPPPRVELRARPVATVRGYEVQVATDSSFVAPVATASVEAPKWTFTPETGGVYWWRWRARGGGVESPWGGAKRLTVRLASPDITSPRAGERIGFRTPEIGTTVSWKPVPGAAGYEVVASGGATGDDAAGEVARVRVAVPPAVLPSLEAGSYSVRVEALASSGPPAISEPVVFELVALPPLAAPALTEPADDAWLPAGEDGLAVRFLWGPVDGAGSYELEVARAGADDWVSSRAEETAAVRDPLGRGTYRWRVRAVDDAGVPGPYTESRAFRVAPPPPASAVIDIHPEPVSPADGEARIDILLQDDRGAPVAGVDVEASAVRGAVRDLRDEGAGRYVARYVPPGNDAGEDTVSVTVRGLTSFRAEESVRLTGSNIGLVAGASVGLVSNFEAVLSPTVHAEVGYRLPWWHQRVMATLRAGYHFAREEWNADSRVVAKQYSVPIAVGLKIEFPYWAVVPYGSANAVVGVMVGRLEAAKLDPVYRTAVGLGIEAGAGAAVAFGPGSAFAEIRYGWVRGSDDQEWFVFDGGGLVPVVGYRLEL